MRYLKSAMVLACVAFSTSACGGGAGSAGSSLPRGATPSALAHAEIVITVPAKSAASDVERNPQYVSASTQSLTLQVDGGAATAQNLTPTSPNCTGSAGAVSCTIGIVASAATHTFKFETYDGLNGTGNVLSVNSISQTLVADQLNNVDVTLAGVPASLRISAIPGATITGNSASGFEFLIAAAQTFVVDAYDVDGNAIVGAGAPTLAASITGAQPGSGIAVNPVGGNPNEFTVTSTGFGTATLSTSATPTSPLAGSAITATAGLSSTTITTTLAGQLNSSGFTNGTGTAAAFYDPSGITYNAESGNLYVADSGNFAIRQVTLAGAVTPYAGGAGPGFNDGTGTAAHFSGGAVSVVYDTAAGGLAVGDWNNCAIRAVASGGVVTTLVGVLPPAPPSCGYLDGSSSTALIYLDGTGYDSSNHNLYTADVYNCAIRQVSVTGAVTTIAGAYPTSTCVSDVDATGTSARFDGPIGIAYDSGDGNLYVTEAYGCTVRRVTTLGVVTTIAGTTGTCTLTDGTGAAARFNSPYAIAYDSDNGDLYVSDQCSIRQVTTAGVVTTIAGSGSCSFGSADGFGSAAVFDGAPRGLVYVSGTSSLYVADYFGDAIRRVQF